MINPFIYGSPLEPESLIDRDKELKKLIDLTSGGHNVRLPAPRDYGKTSLLKKTLFEAEKQGFIPIYVDFYSVSNYYDVKERISISYKEISEKNKTLKFIKNHIDSIYAEVQLPQIAKAGVKTKSADNKSDENKTLLLHLLRLPEKIYKKNNQKCLIVFDEFQDVMKLDSDLAGAIRSVIQHHNNEAGYVFAGSEPSLLNEIFTNKKNPFWNQSKSIELPPLENEDIEKFVENMFSSSRRNIPVEAMNLFLTTVRGHPQRAMMLAHYMFENTNLNSECDLTIVSEAIEEVDKELFKEFKAYWKGFPVGQQKALKHTANYNKSFYNAEDLRDMHLPTSSLETSIEQLVEEAEVYESGKSKYTLVDPFFERWLKR